jgi:hypothetical protein
MKAVVKKKQFSGIEFSTKFVEFGRPAYTEKLRFPDNITELPAQNVSELLGKYTQLYVFANAETCKCSVRILRLQTALSLKKAALLRDDPHLNTLEKWRRDTVLDCDEEIMNMEAAIGSLKSEQQVAETARDNFDRYISALSRELTRKTNEEQKQRYQT